MGGPGGSLESHNSVDLSVTARLAGNVSPAFFRPAHSTIPPGLSVFGSRTWYSSEPVVTLEAVTAALVTLFDNALTAPVYDGAAVTEQIPPAYVVIGWAEDTEDATVDLAVSSMGNRWDDEAGDITCVAYSWAGNGTLAAHGVIAAGLVDQCRAALLADPTLGGVLIKGYSAHLSRVTRTRQQTDGGPVVRYGFTVSWANLLT